MEQETLLVSDPDLLTHLELLKAALQSDKPVTASSAHKPDGSGVARDLQASTSVNVYSSPEFYWERTFPTLYPYGYGGPSDDFFPFRHMSDYHCHILRRGGGQSGRRFQNNAGSIFATYTYEMKRKVGGIAFAATRKETISTEVDELTNVGTVKALLGTLVRGKAGEVVDLRENFMDYQRSLQQNSEAKEAEGEAAVVVSDVSGATPLESGDGSGVGESDAAIPVVVGSYQQPLTTKEETEFEKLVQLTKRLIPFAKQAQGTPMHINYERKNMLTMLTNPYVTDVASWRWFLTFAYADLYDSRLYEIVLNFVDSAGRNDWARRSEKVKFMSKKERKRHLKNHPALVARLFNAKQFCIWKYILAGIDMPFGQLLDFLRRVEVNLQLLCNFFFSSSCNLFFSV